jgi:ABC-2 type transport system permease protein
MGFSFGLVIWLPMMLGGGRVQPIRAGSPLSGNYLTVVSVYALLLLGEVLIWNHFGFDRAAAQFYFVAPPPLRQVLLAKNCAALVFILLEITAVALVCALFRMPLAPGKVVESYIVTLIFSAYLLAAGNLASVRLPRGVDPTQSWRASSTSRVQPLLLLIYPLLAGPVLIAYAVRYAFNADWLFYPLLALAALFGALLYRMSLGLAVTTALDRREPLLESLARTSGPLA